MVSPEKKGHRFFFFLERFSPQLYPSLSEVPKVTSKRLKIAITGSLCSGKSEVLKVLRSLGVRVLDMDKLTYKLYRTRQKHEFNTLFFSMLYFFLSCSHVFLCSPVDYIHFFIPYA